MSGEFLTLTLAANETKHFVKAGRYFEITDSTYPVNLAFYGHNGALQSTVNNCLSGLFLEDAWGTFSVTNGATAQTITLLLMDSGRGGSRRQPGVVQVVDSRAVRTRAGQAYFWRMTAVGAAGQYPTATIGNPAGSGKRIVINQMTLGDSVSPGVITIGFCNQAVVGAANIQPQSKLSGGAASVATVNASSTAAIGGGANTSGMLSLYSSGQSIVVPLQEPIILLPGAFFGFQGETVASTITAGVEYYEEANT